MTNPLPPGYNPYLASSANPYAPPVEAGQHPYAGPGGMAPPGALVGPSAAPLSAALYTPNQVALATFLGTPLGGSVLMTLNEHRLGRKSPAVATLLLGVLATALILALSFALPEKFPSFPIPLASLVGMRALAQSRHGALVAGHFAAGGRRASGWAAAGIGLLALVVVFVPLVAIFVLIEVVKG